MKSNLRSLLSMNMYLLGMLAGLFVLIGASTSNAQIDWLNTTNSNSFWHEPANWSGGVVPDANDLIRFDTSDPPYEVWWDAITGNRSASGLQVFSGDDVTFLNTDAGDYTLTTTGGGGIVNAKLTLDGVDWSTAGQIDVFQMTIQHHSPALH